MRAQVGDLGGDLGGEHHAAGLVLDGQAVTGLALERGRALPDHLVREAAQAGPERDVGRRPGRRDRGRDAACRVRLARHPGGELGAALPREDEMGVRIDPVADRDGVSLGRLIDGIVIGEDVDDAGGTCSRCPTRNRDGPDVPD